MRFLSCGGELNHHGKYMCDSLYKILGNDFKRVTTSSTNSIRRELGYRDQFDLVYNVDGTNLTEEKIKELIAWADVVDYGGAPEIYLHESIRQNKVVFIRIERLLKEGIWKLLVPSVWRKYHRKYIQYKHNPKVYFLCVSAYAASDLRKIGIIGSNVLQWAYCPQFIEYNIDLFESNCPEVPLRIFWCGRMIHWKHPEIAVDIAEKLVERNVNFKMEIVGTGCLSKKINDQIKKRNLERNVKCIGPVQADSMREYMRTKDIFIATSDRNEGWGVVINESMNSGCVVFASELMGAAPILIKDGENGFLFSLKNISKVVSSIEYLANNRGTLSKIKKSAYLTIKKSYTPDKYAEVFVKLSEEAMSHKIMERDGLGEIAKIR